jgi:hypothetical protein
MGDRRPEVGTTIPSVARADLDLVNRIDKKYAMPEENPIS